MNRDLKIHIPRERIEVRTARSSGAGGQNVNKTETKVELRFKVNEATWLPDSVKTRLRKVFSNRINQEGEFLLSCEETRSQHSNLELAFDRLKDVLASVWLEPKKRIKTKATRSSKEKRLSSKKLHSEKKKNRSRF